MKKPPSSNLPEHENAIGNYLDDMLHQATGISSDKDFAAVVALKDSSLLLQELFLPTAVEDVSLVEAAVEVEAEVAEPCDSGVGPVVKAVESEVKVESQAEISSLEASDFPLQCLMFRVGSNRLSLPLIQLRGVLPWPENLTQLPQSPGWMHGLLKYRKKNIRLVDSAKVFGIKSSADKLPAYILVLGDDGWAITCDQPEDVVSLNYGDIQWHTDKDNSMSVGTIRQSLAMLLNLSGIVNLLEKSD